MAQHDYIISNQTFPNTRVDINNLAEAIATNNSGTSAPTTQYAGQFWIDTTTTTWTLYIHDGTDDIQFATIDTSANTVNFTDSALDVVTDTTPQLGGDLDLNSNDITGTGNINITGTATVTGLTTTGNINFGDNDKANFGASNDLSIYHDSNHSYIEDSGTGNLYIRSSDRIQLENSSGTQTLANFDAGGACRLFYANSKKLETTSSGIDVTGTAVTDGLTVAGNVSIDGGTIKLDGNYPTGTDNVALGNNTLTNITTANNVVAIGGNALSNTTTGGNNVAVGRNALSNPSTSVNNVAVGSSTLSSLTTGYSNTALGHATLNLNTTGTFNTGIGQQALYSNTTGSDNVSVGFYSLLYNTTGGKNTAVGAQALENNTASNNTAVGYQALEDNTSGANNTALGYLALNANTTGSSNTAVGFQALDVNTTGTDNAVFGNDAGGANTTGTDNTYIGRSAGLQTNASSNTFIGRSAGSLVSSGQKNTIIGRYNGNQGGLDITTSSNNIVLSDGDGDIRLAINSAGSATFGHPDPVDSGDAGITFNAAGAPGLSRFARAGTSNTQLLQFYNDNGNVGNITTNGSATAYNTSSDYRLKENVIDLNNATTRLKQLQPKRFNFIADADKTVDGFLAHEVSDIVPEAISGTKDEVDADGNPVYQGIDQSKLVPLLVATIKELEARITALEGA